MPLHRWVLQTLLVACPNHAKEGFPTRIHQATWGRAHALAVVKDDTQVGVTAGRGNKNPTEGPHERLVHRLRMENKSVSLTQVDWHVPANTKISEHVRLSLERRRIAAMRTRSSA